MQLTARPGLLYLARSPVAGEHFPEGFEVALAVFLKDIGLALLRIHTGCVVSDSVWARSIGW